MKLLPKEIVAAHDISVFCNSKPETDNPLKLVASALSREPSLAPYDSKLHWFGGGAIRITFDSLALWLLQRAREAGEQQALADLAFYVNSANLPAQSCIALDGITLDSAIHLAPDLAVLPWNQLPPSPTRNHVSQLALASGIRHPHAAIVHTLQIPKIIYHQDESPTLPELPSEVARDAVLILALVGPVAPYALASWIDVPQSIPSFGTAIMLPEIAGALKRTRLPDSAPADLPPLWLAWQSLPADAKASLRVPLSRLISSMRRNSPVDAAIDLGIAIESAFLSDDSGSNGELKFRIQVRASRWLAKDVSARQDVFGRIGALYNMRSTAVHTGQLGSKSGKYQTSELLAEGHTLMARALAFLVQRGIPDWKALVLE